MILRSMDFIEMQILHSNRKMSESSLKLYLAFSLELQEVLKNLVRLLIKLEREFVKIFNLECQTY